VKKYSDKTENKTYCTTDKKEYQINWPKSGYHSLWLKGQRGWKAGFWLGYSGIDWL